MGNKNNVEKYLDSLPDDVDEINVSFNNLRSLPVLPEKLQTLCCSYNNLTSLPILPENLKYLSCSYNNLTSLPVLPENLERLYCYNNNLTSLPVLPEKLEILYFYNNPIYEIIYDDNLIIIKKKIKTLNNFRYLYYCIKYKKIFLRMMEVVIKKRYHPSYLYNLKEEDDLDEKLGEW
uniref:Leucine-rich repeat protein n=1 Tax=viral metagenome TaxID=1070528 RepID=A0A6C0H5V2_9ZZZZ